MNIQDILDDLDAGEHIPNNVVRELCNKLNTIYFWSMTDTERSTGYDFSDANRDGYIDAQEFVQEIIEGLNG